MSQFIFSIFDAFVAKSKRIEWMQIELKCGVSFVFNALTVYVNFIFIDNKSWFLGKVIGKEETTYDNNDTMYIYIFHDIRVNNS